MEKRNLKEIIKGLRTVEGLTMNELLLITYKAETGANTFKTFKQWKESGKTVQKGEKGFPIFSRPIGVIKEEKGKEASQNDFKYFGTCYLFNELQVK